MNRSIVDRRVSDRRGPSRGRRMSDRLAALCVVADIGFQHAGRAITEMAGEPVVARASQVRQLAVAEVPALVGGADQYVVAAYLHITGDIEGHMVLMLHHDEGIKLASAIIGEEVAVGADLPDMATSALGEVGNIMGSFFLTALADASELRLNPSPPAVVSDLSGAILDVILADLSIEGENVLVIDTLFEQAGTQVDAFFLVLPSPAHLEMLLDRLPK